MFPKQNHNLPDYHIRISKRARRIAIKVLPHGVVEVVLPQGVDEKSVPLFLQQRSAWLNHAMLKVSQQRELNPHTHSLKPALIHLSAVEQKWSVEYRIDQQKIKVNKSSLQIILPANEPPQQTAERLRKWLQRHAKEILPAWLLRVREETGHCVNSISVRGQKTRWGSYSSAGNVNLNRNLLFLPADTVRYLFVHELSHSLHMNHSQAFWDEVKKHQCDYLQHERILRERARQLPTWAYA